MILTVLLAAAFALPPALEAEVDAAVADGLPTASLENKAAEGLAKGVPVARIAAVLAAEREAMREVRPLLPSGATDDALRAAGRARSAGASAASLASLARQGEPLRTQALWAYADILGQGLQQGQALRLVDSALQADDPQATLHATTIAVSRLRVQGQSPDQVGRQVARALAAGGPALATLPATAGGPATDSDHAMPWQAHGGNAGGQGKPEP